MGDRRVEVARRQDDCARLRQRLEIAAQIEGGEGALLRDDGGLDDLLGDLTDDIDNGDLDLD